MAALVTLLCAHAALQPMSRRAALLSAGAVAISGCRPAYATDPRTRVLDAIAADAPEQVVLAEIEALVRQDPSDGKAATSQALDGTWRLLWSAGADKFSPLLGLPRPIRPESLQLLGPAAAEQVGEGRVANLLRLPLGATARLSSGVRPAADEASTLEILPPFRFEAVLGSTQKTLVEAGSDADFRKLNARDAEAQAAPKNLYAQRYLETSGTPGDLRVSTVVSGDPVIVGSVFVHQRVR